MKRSRVASLLLLLLALPVAGAGAAAPPARLELAHPAGGHEVHVSAPAVAMGADGKPIVAWITGGHANTVLVARPGEGGEPTRVNPPATSADSLHQAPGLAVGPGGEVYVTWSSPKPKPEGVLFASDLYLSRSLDGGRTFEAPLRVNDDRPISHSFENLAVAPDGTVLVAWIDSRDGARETATYVARVAERGSRLERVTRLEGGETCVCCRVSVGGRARRRRRRAVAQGLRRRRARHGPLALGRRRAHVRRRRDRPRRSLEDHRLPAPRRPGGRRRARPALRGLVHGGRGRPARRAVRHRARRPSLRRAPARAHGDGLGARPRAAGDRRRRPRDRRVGGFHRGAPPDLATLRRGGRPQPRPRPHALARRSRRGRPTSPSCRAGSWSPGTRSNFRRRRRSWCASPPRRDVDEDVAARARAGRRGPRGATLLAALPAVRPAPPRSRRADAGQPAAGAQGGVRSAWRSCTAAAGCRPAGAFPGPTATRGRAARRSPSSSATSATR